MTSYIEIYEKFAIKISDYTLDKMYIASTPTYNAYVKGFLINAIPKFTTCNQDLSLRDDTTSTFSIVLTDLEKEILATGMVIEWLSKEVHSILELRRYLSDSDFKLYSESNNLREKRELLNVSEERLEKLKNQYNYTVFDFDLFSG